MSVLSRLSSVQGRRDEAPNKELARDLVDSVDKNGIQEVADNLKNEDKRIQADCLSVMEQIGLIDPELIVGYSTDFLDLIYHKENRIVWAAMINLSLVADKKPAEIFNQFESIAEVIDKGSVITRDSGILVLAKIASVCPEYGKVILPYLMEQMRFCRPKSVPQYAESISIAINADYKKQFLEILNERMEILSAAQRSRVKKLIKSL